MMVSAVRDKSINVSCQMCNLEYNVLVSSENWKEWKSGEKYIQQAFDYLSANERELLLTATCDDCWQILYEAEMRDGEDE